MECYRQICKMSLDSRRPLLFGHPICFTHLLDLREQKKTEKLKSLFRKNYCYVTDFIGSLVLYLTFNINYIYIIPLSQSGSY